MHVFCIDNNMQYAYAYAYQEPVYSTRIFSLSYLKIKSKWTLKIACHVGSKISGREGQE